jgi:hypothetical protein
MRRALLAVLLLPLAAAAQQPSDWNPRPAEGDLALPLPCGQGLVLRRVPTPMAEGRLADRRAVLGDEETDAPYSEHVREAFVAGAFGSGQGAHYWIGKYEVTRGQFAAVMQGCEALAALTAQQRRLPQAEVPLLEAMRFAERATQAVLRLDAAALPARGPARGFLRLPTEEEWEFAARGGGIGIGEAEFRQRLPPLPGRITEHAQLRPAGREVPPRMVGLLAPDRLGLHDMLGNVAEMVGSPYRLTRAGRAGGMAGGLVARGGDIEVPPDRIRTSLRVEHPPLRPDGTPTALPTLGFRLVLALPIVTDLATAGELRREWEREAGAAPEGLPDDPRALLQSLESRSLDPAERRALAGLRAAVEAERMRRAEADARAVRSAIGAGAVLIRSLRNEHRGVVGREATLLPLRRRPPADPRDQARLSEAEADLALWQRARDTTFASLGSLILQQLDLPQALLEAELGLWRQEHAGAEFATLRDFAGQFVREVAAARAGRALPRDAFARLTAGIGQPGP